MAIQINGTNVVDNNRRGIFAKANPGTYIIYNSTEQSLQFWTGSEWKSAGLPSVMTKYVSRSSLTNCNFTGAMQGSNTDRSWQNPQNIFREWQRTNDTHSTESAQGLNSTFNVKFMTLPFTFNGKLSIKLYTPSGGNYYGLSLGGAASANFGSVNQVYIDVNGCTNGTVIYARYSDGGNSGGYFKWYDIKLNDFLLLDDTICQISGNNYVKYKICTVNVEDGSVFTGGNYIYGDNGATGKVLSVNGNALIVYDPIGEFNGSTYVFPVKASSMLPWPHSNALTGSSNDKWQCS